MDFRTDLALERREILGAGEIQGVIQTEKDKKSAHISKIEVTDENGEKAIGKPIGRYITVEVPNFSRDGEILDDRLEAVTEELSALLPKEGLVLVVGLGNDNITPDALGPRAADLILATRHISSELAKSIGLEHLRPVAGIAPGVLGQTGIETGEIILGIVKSVKPSAVITIDALASRKLSRLGSTVQLADTGVVPGSGVGNARTQLNQQSLGVPVIAVGVPTVVDAATLAFDLISEKSSNFSLKEEDIVNMFDESGSKMIVTPREIDLLIERAAKLIALSINCALQPSLSVDDIMAFTS